MGHPDQPDFYADFRRQQELDRRAERWHMYGWAFAGLTALASFVSIIAKVL